MDHRRKLTEVLGERLELWNLYGPTEASVEVAYFKCEDSKENDLSHGFPLGYAPANVGLHIVSLDESMSPVPKGEKGELCISGIQVADGYFGRPDLTAVRFVPLPSWAGAPAKMYRTGDLARQNPTTGWFEYCGRVDRQVKVGGVRIELGEVEAVTLRLFPEALETAAVVLIEKRLVGVVVPRSGVKAPTDAQLMGALRDELPQSYVPAEWHSTNALPLSSAGKTDFRAVGEWVKRRRTVQLWGDVYDNLYEDNATSADGDVTMDR